MDANTFNVIISIGLVAALVVFGIVQIVALVTGHPIAWIEGLTLALVALLQAYRHASDVKNANGSSGITPKDTPPTPPGG